MFTNPVDLLLLHAAATWSLVGLIWTVQVVQYPGFARVGHVEFPAFHTHHSARITWIVGPLMLVELSTGLALFPVRPPGVTSGLLWAGIVLIAINWAATALVSVPLHARLDQGGRRAQRRLVLTNWIRTAAWSARGLIVLIALRAAFSSS